MSHDLSVRALRATPVLVPMRRPLGTSAMLVSQAPLLLLDLETTQGITGRAYLFCYLGSAARAAVELLRDAAEWLRGVSVHPGEMRKMLETRYRLIGARGLTSMVTAGIDMAAWDAVAQHASLPLAVMLGGSCAPIPAYNSNGLGLIGAEAAVDEALELAAEGFSAIKMRLGRANPRDDLAAVRAVRSALPDDVALMADFNQALTAFDAMARCRPLEDEGLYWIEEPVRHDDYSACAALSQSLATPIQIGENFQGPRAMHMALQAKASDFVMPDVERIGGVSGWMEAAALAHTAGVPMSSHLFPEISAHLLAATPTAHWLEYVDWAHPILQAPPKIENGAMRPSTSPGNGLVWDAAAVDRYRMA